MKSEYLSELLITNKTVILPGIGAFVNNAPLPVGFNPYLKFNDGMLVAFISQKESITAGEAGKKLETFTNGLVSLLESGRDVAVTGLGKLKMENEKIVFTADPDAKPVEEKPVKKDEKPAIVTVEEKPDVPFEEPVKEEISKPQPEILSGKTNVERSEIPQGGKEKISAEKKPEEKTQEKTEQQKTSTVISEKVATVKDPVSGRDNVTGKSKTAINKSPRSSRKKWVALTIVILILGGGGTAGYFYKDQLLPLIGLGKEKTTAENKTGTKKEPDKNETPETEPVATEDASVSNDTVQSSDPIIPESETVTEEPVTAAPEPETFNEKQKTINEKPLISSGSYYVIVGCYSQQSNADAMMTRVSEKNFSASNIGTFNGLIHIAAYQASDLTEATNKASELRTVFGKAWVFYAR